MSEDDVIKDGSDGESDTVDYSKEADRLSEGGNDGYDSVLVKVPEGRTVLKILNEGNITTFNYGTDDKPDLQEKVLYDVKVVEGHVEHRDEDGDVHKFTPGHEEDLTYAVTRAETESSQFGQIVKYVNSLDGTAEGTEITVLRTGTGTDTNYMIQEATELESE